MTKVKHLTEAVTLYGEEALTEEQDFKIARKAYGAWGFALQRIGGKYSLTYHGEKCACGSWQDIRDYLYSDEDDDEVSQ